MVWKVMRTILSILDPRLCLHSQYDPEKEEKVTQKRVATGSESIAIDVNNHRRTEAHSDAIIRALDQQSRRHAHAKYPYDGTGEGELAFTAGTELEFLNDRDQEWWYARDPKTMKEGIAPADHPEEATQERIATGSESIAIDANNHMRTEGPSDAIIRARDQESGRLVHARYSFDGTGEGELALRAGMNFEILDDLDQAWWYARDPRTGQEGLVPVAYLEEAPRERKPESNDPFAIDARDYMRVETPSDTMIGARDQESGMLAHARYSFDGAGEGELPLTAGMELEILDDRDQAWWYARDPRTRQKGVVPAAYLY